jgi:hypothetical protein
MKRIVVVLFAGLLAGGMVSDVAFAQNKEKAEKKAEKAEKTKKHEVSDPTVALDPNADISNVSGTVIVTKDKKAGEVTDIELQTSSGFKFKITRDDASKYLEQKNGENVDLTGVIAQKEGQKWVTIKKPVVLAPVEDKAKIDEKQIRKAKKADREKRPAKKVNFEF